MSHYLNRVSLVDLNFTTIPRDGKSSPTRWVAREGGHLSPRLFEDHAANCTKKAGCSEQAPLRRSPPPSALPVPCPVPTHARARVVYHCRSLGLTISLAPCLPLRTRSALDELGALPFLRALARQRVGRTAARLALLQVWGRQPRVARLHAADAGAHDLQEPHLPLMGGEGLPVPDEQYVCRDEGEAVLVHRYGVVMLRVSVARRHVTPFTREWSTSFSICDLRCCSPPPQRCSPSASRRYSHRRF